MYDTTIKSAHKIKTGEMPVFEFSGRSSGVRTHDLYVPNVALYQAELYSANNCGADYATFSNKLQLFLSALRFGNTATFTHMQNIKQRI